MSKTTNKHKSLSKAALQCEVDREREGEREDAPGWNYSQAGSYLTVLPSPCPIPLWVQIEDNVVTSTKTAQREQ